MRPQRVLLFLSRLSLTWRFAIAAAGVMAVVFAASAWMQQRAIVDGTLRDARDDVQQIVAHRIVPRLTQDDLATPLSGPRLEAFDSFVRDQLLGDDAERIVIVSARGQLLYSSERDEIGQRFPHDNAQRQAFAGASAASVAPSAEANQVAGVDGRQQAVEIAVPLFAPGSRQVNAAVGFYRPYA